MNRPCATAMDGPLIWMSRGFSFRTMSVGTCSLMSVLFRGRPEQIEGCSAFCLGGPAKSRSDYLTEQAGLRPSYERSERGSVEMSAPPDRTKVPPRNQTRRDDWARLGSLSCGESTRQLYILANCPGKRAEIALAPDRDRGQVPTHATDPAFPINRDQSTFHPDRRQIRHLGQLGSSR
jgi:hypothetical protein